jgi:hypothetical protein
LGLSFFCHFVGKIGFIKSKGANVVSVGVSVFVSVGLSVNLFETKQGHQQQTKVFTMDARKGMEIQITGGKYRKLATRAWFDISKNPTQ